MIDHLKLGKEMCMTCKKPLKEFKMLIAFGTGFIYETKCFHILLPLWCGDYLEVSTPHVHNKMANLIYFYFSSIFINKPSKIFVPDTNRCHKSLSLRIILSRD